nr:hypothetical protein [uncultured Oscillibacter sp.]
MADVSALIRKRAEESKAWREAMEADRGNLSEMRDTGLKEVTSNPEQYMSYLRLQADNIQCSAGNVVLTMYQLDGATRIGSLNYWHEQGRRVLDEEMKRGAKVFVPPRNKKYRYILGDYYDISQTSGRPVQEAPRITENEGRMEAALAALMKSTPVGIIEDTELASAAYYDSDQMALAINTSYPEPEIFAALSTELAYAHFHDRGRNPYFTRLTCRMDAETIGYLVCRRFGIPCQEPNAAGIELHYQDFTVSNRSDALEELRKTARDMGDSVEQAIQPRQRDMGRRRQFGR